MAAPPSDMQRKQALLQLSVSCWKADRTPMPTRCACRGSCKPRNLRRGSELRDPSYEAELLKAAVAADPSPIHHKLAARGHHPAASRTGSTARCFSRSSRICVTSEKHSTWSGCVSCRAMPLPQAEHPGRGMWQGRAHGARHRQCKNDRGQTHRAALNHASPSPDSSKCRVPPTLGRFTSPRDASPDPRSFLCWRTSGAPLVQMGCRHPALTFADIPARVPDALYACEAALQLASCELERRLK